MIKNILFDFDGVILDSMKIKGDGFVELFSDYSNDDVKLIEKYHYDNGGVSRFEKIRYFFNNIISKNISDEEVLILAGTFSKIIDKKLYDKNCLISETVKFISNNHKKYNLHIVSASEHNELNSLCDFFSIANYFITINGSPTEKKIIVNEILNKYNYKKNETILIGDSYNDYDAAVNNNIDFYGYNNLQLRNDSKIKYIDFFEEFYI